MQKHLNLALAIALQTQTAPGQLHINLSPHLPLQQVEINLQVRPPVRVPLRLRRLFHPASPLQPSHLLPKLNLLLLPLRRVNQ